MSSIVPLDIDRWDPAIDATATAQYAHALEGGAVLALPHLPFALTAGETRFLDARWSDGRAKNISLDGARIKGAQGSAAELAALAAMVARFAVQASGVVAALLPRYAPYLTRARTSYRPQPASGRAVSWRKDDTRMHIDAFPSRPNHGERILRVFCNVNPHGADRVWRVGEPFAAMAAHFLPSIRRMRAGEAAALAVLHVTKGRRSEYDHLMLRLHDAAKADPAYQRDSAQEEARFAPGTTWICYSDQVMHAAMGGQYMFEQTINLPLKALYDADSAPLAILARLTGRPLVAAR